jgi:hypothetical protein
MGSPCLYFALAAFLEVVARASVVWKKWPASLDLDILGEEDDFLIGKEGTEARLFAAVNDTPWQLIDRRCDILAFSSVEWV